MSDQEGTTDQPTSGNGDDSMDGGGGEQESGPSADVPYSDVEPSTYNPQRRDRTGEPAETK